MKKGTQYTISFLILALVLVVAYVFSGGGLLQGKIFNNSDFSVTLSPTSSPAQNVAIGQKSVKAGYWDINAKNSIQIQSMILQYNDTINSSFIQTGTLTDENGIPLVGPVSKSTNGKYLQFNFSTPLTIEKQTKKTINLILDISDIAKTGETFKFTVRYVKAVNSVTAENAKGSIKANSLFANPITIYGGSAEPLVVTKDISFAPYVIESGTNKILGKWNLKNGGLNDLEIQSIPFDIATSDKTAFKGVFKLEKADGLVLTSKATTILDSYDGDTKTGDGSLGTYFNLKAGEQTTVYLSVSSINISAPALFSTNAKIGNIVYLDKVTAAAYKFMQEIKSEDISG